MNMKRHPFHPPLRRYPPSPNHHQTAAATNNNHHHRHLNHQKPNQNYSRRNTNGPPAPAKTCLTSPSNFIVHLHADSATATTSLSSSSSSSSSVPRDREATVNSLISQCGASPDRVVFPISSRVLIASLHFGEWSNALSAMTSLWDLRLRGVHGLAPKLQSNMLVPSDAAELEQALNALFINHIRNLIAEGQAVREWRMKLSEKCDEIAEVSRLLGGRNRLGTYTQLVERKERLAAERDLIGKRLREFKAAMKSILSHLGEEEVEEEEERMGVELFVFEKEINWERIHMLVSREIRRLQDGLPIYAVRRDILRRIHDEQIMVLIGETGSGKSTQLVQFLADSGVAAAGSIVCTQPRKIAAISLAARVREESSGCYESAAVKSYQTFLSGQRFDSKVIYMTDHCLLQHYMNDRNLAGVSCIVIDEAHERSLNTDLLLALLKDLLLRRQDLWVVIMSATADAHQLAAYFYGCKIFHVLGRNFPVDIRYIPCATEVTGSGIIAPYVYEVVRVASEIHQKEEEGTILAFLTSQHEVEWASEKFCAPFAVALPLHGKLSFEEQFRIFQNYPGKRKVIFATNVAETSLTIPGVKYVVDSGMVKESKFEPGSGMNVLRVCMTSKSSATQRAGRAGRTGPGRCYRLYADSDFESMPPNQEPEIRRVHLGVAVLRILALGIKNVEEFDFVDAPSAKAIDTAIRNLVQLGAIALNHGVYELTHEGRYLVKLGIEPRLAKVILGCIDHRLSKEGLVLAAMMANAGTIFCRVGTDDNKLKADCLKVQFCHRNGDLFTLLSVYQEWEALPPSRRNKWCWDNSINAKSMRRCEDTVRELEISLQKELNVITASYWRWSCLRSSECDYHLKKIILTALSENVAMYSGCDQLGFEVALTGQHVGLHPSCSLLVFSEKPSWVVFGEILSGSNQYLTCVTAFDFESLSMLNPPPLFDATKMERQRLQVKVMTGFGSTLLKKLCGRSNCNLLSLVSRIQTACSDESINVQVNVNQNEILLFATSEHMKEVSSLVNEAVECERKWLQNECMEKRLYHGAAVSPVALFGAGAVIKHLELEKRFLTVDVFQSTANPIEDKELLMLLEKISSGKICAFRKSMGFGQEGDEKEKWGSVTFITPDAARKAAEMNEFQINGSMFRFLPSETTLGGDSKMFSFPAVKAKIFWPRRYSKGFAVVRCDIHDVHSLIDDFSRILIGGKLVRAEQGRKSADSVIVGGLDRELDDADILEALRNGTKRRILDFFLVRGDPVNNPPPGACEEAILKEISPFMYKRNPHSSCCRVQVWPPEAKDSFMKAMITFDGRLHLEAAKALEHMEGKVLPGCCSWQKIRCQRLFHSSLSCPATVYLAIRKQLDSLLASFKNVQGADWSLEKNDNGSYRVKISANATRTVAELRRPLEELIKGRTLNDANITPTVLQHLFSRNGMNLMKVIQRETGTYILFDRHNFNVRVFGPSDKIAVAQQRLIHSLLSYHESKQLEIHLRGGGLPPNLMKEVVKAFGPDLCGLKEKVPGAEFTLNTRQHLISVHGDRELKQQVEQLIFEVAQMTVGLADRSDSEAACPICLCEIDDGYRLDGCGHLFCALCLVEQFESAIKNMDSFPILCTSEGCRSPIVVNDLRSLLSNEKLEELFRASLGSFVASSGGTYRFCPSPDCPSVYQVSDPETSGEPFMCGACFAETCTRCHLEYHPYMSCEKYREFKEDPDSSLNEWRRDRENVKVCPVCGYVIEKIDGCNHVECKCGKHICWVCLEFFNSADDCYNHLRSIHLSIDDFLD